MAQADCALRRYPERLTRWLLLAATVSLGACQSAVLNPQGSIGRADRTILIDSLAIMLAIAVPTIIATFAFAWWYRASNRKARYLPDWEFSGRIEIVVWAIPTLTILLLGGVTWIGAHDLDPAVPIESTSPPLEIEAVSMDWKWLFIYPEHRIASVNELVVPAGQPLHFRLTSSSVMNAFFVPQLGSMIYTMNGMVTELYLDADHPGTYRGMSGHYSGEGFSDMHFPVRAVSAEEFAHWVNAVKDSGPTLDGAAYDALARPSLNPKPVTYANVDIDLFSRVLTQDLAPAPGPGTEREGASETTHTKEAEH
jgi:cytochrome o ubiquinol oxidase subunit II